MADDAVGVLGVTLAVAIMIFQREGQNLFAQTDFGYDVLIGPPKGSPLQLTLNTVYHMDESPGVIPYALFEDMCRKDGPAGGQPDYRPYVKHRDPVHGRRQLQRAGGSSGRRRRCSGLTMTASRVAGQAFEYRKDKSYELAAGRVFHPQKVRGRARQRHRREGHFNFTTTSSAKTRTRSGTRTFHATHGMPAPDEKPDIHKPRWHIVGILKPTHTANDRVLFVPFISLYAIAEHEGGMIDQALMKANIDPSRDAAGQIDEVLAKLGFDPREGAGVGEEEVSDEAGGGRRRPAAKPAPGGDLLQDVRPTTPATAVERPPSPRPTTKTRTRTRITSMTRATSSPICRRTSGRSRRSW